MNSLLSELPLSMHETWLLPKSEVLCMIRHQEGPPEDAHEDVQVPKSTDEENQWKEPRTSPRPRTSGPWSVVHYSSTSARSYRPRTYDRDSPDIRPLPSPRTSAHRPGNPAPSRATNATTPARTSGLPCLRCHIPSFWHCSSLASCVHHVYIFET